MTQATSAETVMDTDTHEEQPRAIKMPMDGLYRAIAVRVGGTKAIEIERFLKFATVGFLGALVDLGTLNILQNTILPASSDINVAITVTTSFTLAVIHNFLWNRYWTYPDSRSRSIRRQLSQFAIVSVIGWLARTTWITLSYAALGGFVVGVIQSFNTDYTASVEVANNLGTNLATFIGIFFVMIWNFTANRLWTYNDVDGA